MPGEVCLADLGLAATGVGTLDALHLEIALSIREIENVDLLLTRDSQLATTARSLGFREALRRRGAFFSSLARSD